MASWKIDRDAAAAGSGFGLGLQFLASLKEQESSLRPGVLDGQSQDCLDQLFEDDFAGYGV
jgi:hypothetical protein